jgi:general secretion pathway protein K
MRSSARRGVILVTVLWSIVLLSTLAMATSLTFRGFAGIMAIDRDRLKADGLLTAGLEVAAGLTASAGETPLNGVESTVSLSSGVVAIRLDDEGGRIDIGRAPVEVLAALFRAIGAPDAEAIAQRIVEWRKPDVAAATSVVPRNPDAGEDDPEPAAPANANRPTPSAAAPAKKPTPESIFTNVAQLLQVPDMRPEWVAAVAPLTTVFGNETVNPLTAPAAVLAALPGINPGRLAAFLEVRRRPMDPAQLAGMLGATQAYLAVKRPQAVSVRLRAVLTDGFAAEANAVIVCLKGDRQPYRVLVWNLTPPPSRP